VREAAARTQSVNNLKQIGLAAQAFHDGNKRLPFNGTGISPVGGAVTYFQAARSNSPTSGSWLFQILPYIDQQVMFNLNGNNTANGFTAVGIQAYMCPGRGRPNFTTTAVGVGTTTGAGPWSDYFINVILNGSSQSLGFNNADAKRTLVGITDGSSNTIFAGHGYIDRGQYSNQAASANVSTCIWFGGTQGTARGYGSAVATYPTGTALPPTVTTPAPASGLMRDDLGTTAQRPAATGTTGTNQMPWGGPFPQGALFVWCDGTVRMVAYSISQLPPTTTAPTVFSAYLTPTGGEAATLPD